MCPQDLDGHQAAAHPVPGAIGRDCATSLRLGRRRYRLASVCPADRWRVQAAEDADTVPGGLGAFGSVVLEDERQIDFPAPEETIVVSRCGVDTFSFGHRQSRPSPVGK